MPMMMNPSRISATGQPMESRVAGMKVVMKITMMKSSSSANATANRIARFLLSSLLTRPGNQLLLFSCA